MWLVKIKKNVFESKCKRLIIEEDKCQGDVVIVLF